MRPMTAGDLPAVLRLLHDELGWPNDHRAVDLWRWKHESNPFGPSCCWVGVDSGEVVAIRVFMRWTLVDHAGALHRAARAVDTATHAAHRRLGWFRRLTTAALHELAADGVTVLFNTPNEQSLPANESMGWVEQPRPRIWVRPSNAQSMLRLARARTSAELWPEPTSVGVDPDQAWSNPDIARVLGTARRAAVDGLVTAHSEEHIRWRYGNPALGYRFVGDGEAVAVVRTRRRGAALERALLDWWGGANAARSAVADQASFDHALALGARPGRGWLPVPGAGPRVVARSMGHGPLPGSLQPVLGDLELL